MFESWPLPLSNLTSLSLCFLICRRRAAIPDLEGSWGALPGLHKRKHCVYTVWVWAWYIVGAQCLVAVIIFYVLGLHVFCTSHSTFIQVSPITFKGGSILLNVGKWGLTKLMRATDYLKEIHGTDWPVTGTMFLGWIGRWVWQGSGTRAGQNYALRDQRECAMNKVQSRSLPESL